MSVNNIIVFPIVKRFTYESIYASLTKKKNADHRRKCDHSPIGQTHNITLLSRHNTCNRRQNTARETNSTRIERTPTRPTQ